MQKRRAIALICVVAFLFAMCSPAAFSLDATVLVPIDPLFGLVVVSALVPIADPSVASHPPLAVVGSRPPPVF